MSLPTENLTGGSLLDRARHELQHLAGSWLCFVLLGALLMLVGVAAVAVPKATVGTTFAVAIFMGLMLMIGGISTIISAFWVGKWSGFLIQMLVGILYVACGLIMTERPGLSVFAMTVFIAMSFVVMGIFRIVAALSMRHSEWGWALLNGVITMLAGITIYRHLDDGIALWVIGLLVGLEMMFNGLTWLMLGLALRKVKNAA